MKDSDDEFDAFFDRWGNQGLRRFRRELHVFAADAGLAGLLGCDDRQLFARRSLALFQCVTMHRYGRARYRQLSEASFSIWVFRTGGTCHSSIDGLILPSGHDFWVQSKEDVAFICNCWVSGAHNLRAAQRRGGNSEMTLAGKGVLHVPISGFGPGPALRLSGWLRQLEPEGR